MSVSLFVFTALVLSLANAQCDDHESPGWVFNFSCCSAGSPCPLGEGDCDIDAHCAGGDNICGTNNCVDLHPGEGFPPAGDCCMERCADHTDPGWTFDLGCCATLPCQLGEGDCDGDSQCAGDYVCGTNNCRTLHGNQYPAVADCCVELCADHTNPSWAFDFGCCQDAPCPLNEGDCDNDDQCAGGLICGTNNCADLHPGAGYPASADCCVAPCYDHDVEGWEFDFNCCTATNPCPLGEGDCDNATQCAGNLFCGNNNCAGLHPGAGFPATADCCEFGIAPVGPGVIAA